jgi:hypothetical protein
MPRPCSAIITGQGFFLVAVDVTSTEVEAVVFVVAFAVAFVVAAVAGTVDVIRVVVVIAAEVAADVDVSWMFCVDEVTGNAAAVVKLD